jgi:hypothetical protein
MCHGCEDLREYELIIDAYLAKELPKLLAQPIDDSVLYGSHGHDD